MLDDKPPIETLDGKEEYLATNQKLGADGKFWGQTWGYWSITDYCVEPSCPIYRWKKYDDGNDNSGNDGGNNIDNDDGQIMMTIYNFIEVK